MIVFSSGFWIGVACGGAVIWFGKDTLLKLALGAEALSAKLRAKADALKARL